MTPAQALKRLSTPTQQCELSEQSPADFARSAQLSAYECIKQKTCPICGAKGSTELWYGGAGEQHTFFYCHKSQTHVYEVDGTTADRVPM